MKNRVLLKKKKQSWPPYDFGTFKPMISYVPLEIIKFLQETLFEPYIYKLWFSRKISASLRIEHPVYILSEGYDTEIIIFN